jgi:hypothetical protein
MPVTPPIDWDNPCARLAALRAAYYSLIAGTTAYQFSYTANGVTRSASYSVIDKSKLLAEIELAENECPNATPTRRRFAITAGARRA